MAALVGDRILPEPAVGVILVAKEEERDEGARRRLQLHVEALLVRVGRARILLRHAEAPQHRRVLAKAHGPADLRERGPGIRLRHGVRGQRAVAAQRKPKERRHRAEVRRARQRGMLRAAESRRRQRGCEREDQQRALHAACAPARRRRHLPSTHQTNCTSSALLRVHWWRSLLGGRDNCLSERAVIWFPTNMRASGRGMHMEADL